MDYSKRTILVTIDWFIPGFKSGGPVRSMVNLIDQLKGEFKFKVITRDRDYCEKLPYKDVKSDQWVSLSEHLQVYYLSPKSINKRSLTDLIVSQKNQVDLIFVNGIYSYFFSILPLYIAKKNQFSEIIISTRGMLGRNAIGVKSKKKNLFLFFARIFKLYKGVTFHATNEDEKDDITRVLRERKIQIIPNLPKKTSGEMVTPKTRGELKLVFLGRISPEKNLLGALSILSSINSGNIKFSIYGSVYNEEYWRDCQGIIKKLNCEVEYFGNIDSNKVQSVLKENHFLFLPTKGENYGHAIVESLQSMTPVIISNKTPWRKLEHANVGWDIDLSNSDGFKMVIEYCINLDHPSYENLAKESKVYIDNMIDIQELKLKYESLFMNNYE
jgi:glycosyltransferase involved in cell wall biosynthesis